MGILLVAVPYDCGQPGVRMGAGPERMLGWAKQSGSGHHLRQTIVSLPPRFHTEWDALAALQEEITRLVSSALATNDRAIILSGNCGPALLGAIGATGGASTAVCWFDAHGDFNTPETSPSGFLDGMALAIATGACWSTAALRLQGLTRLPEQHVIHVGGRSLDPQEVLRFDRSRITRVGRDELQTLPARVRTLPAAVRHLYLHIDLDVLDPSELRANPYAEPNGLSVEQLVAAIRSLTRERQWTVAALTALDPSCDAGRAPDVVQRLTEVLLDS